jgi:hypothetical protein
MDTQQNGGRRRIFFNRVALIAAAGIALSGVAGCKSDSHADSNGNCKPGGKTSEADAPDCYKGTGSGRGRFKSNLKFAPDAPAAPASGAFDILLGDSGPSTAPIPDSDLLLGWGGGGDGGGHDKKPC